MESATHYKQILQKEKGQFDMALKSQIQQKVGGKIEENKNYEVRLKQVEDQIKRLQEEIVQVQKAMAENDKVRIIEETKLNEQQELFEKTYTRIQAEIDKDTNKINEFL